MTRSLRVCAALVALPCLVWGLSSCASSGSSTKTGSTGGDDDINLCEAWVAWTPPQKKRFLEQIWEKSGAAAASMMKKQNFNERQIAAFNDCFSQKMPEFTRSLDKTCSDGAVMNSEKVGEQVGRYIPTCSDQTSAR